MKVVVASLFVISLVLSSALLDVANAQYSPAPPVSSPPLQPPSPSGFCGQKCGVRCSKAGKRSRCLRYCLMCCDRCKCVPSGTYGNKDECPCYRDWKSPNNGRPKCP